MKSSDKKAKVEEEKHSAKVEAHKVEEKKEKAE